MPYKAKAVIRILLYRIRKSIIPYKAKFIILYKTKTIILYKTKTIKILSYKIKIIKKMVIRMPLSVKAKKTKTI